MYEHDTAPFAYLPREVQIHPPIIVIPLRSTLAACYVVVEGENDGHI